MKKILMSATHPLGIKTAVKLKNEDKIPMLVLQILTAALTISFAKANPVAIDVRNWEVPTADGNLKRGELVAASHASHYAEYIPTATETSLTRNYYEKRATCLEQFVWYCGIPAGACMTFVANPVRFLFLSSVPG
jgi:hypothetical protein